MSEERVVGEANATGGSPLGASTGDPETLCRICGGIGQLTFHRPAFDVLRCESCSTVFVRPKALSLQREMDQRADELGPRYVREVFAERQDFWLAFWTERIRSVEAVLGRRGRLLDIGCGTGEFQLAAQRRGWSAVGVEPSTLQSAYARDVLKLDVRTGFFEDVDFEPASFDVVSAWGVIEHLQDPRSFLERVRQLLKHDGVLALQTPNQASLITEIAGFGYRISGGRFLLGVYSFEHLFRFDSKTLTQLLQWTGYRVLHMDQYDNLEVMLARMHLEPHARLRRAVLTPLHALAALTKRRNQLVAYARLQNSAGDLQE
jgi:2-polyprenyl-3-methyl-5-hydroxy-6-metoxy-1,4-benzoquinol methylase